MSDIEKLTSLSRRGFLRGLAALLSSEVIPAKSLPLGFSDKTIANLDDIDLPQAPDIPGCLKEIYAADEADLYIQEYKADLFQNVMLSELPIAPGEFLLPDAMNIYALRLSTQNHPLIRYPFMHKSHVTDRIMQTIRLTFSDAVKFMACSKDDYLAVVSYQADKNDLRQCDRWLKNPQTLKRAFEKVTLPEDSVLNLTLSEKQEIQTWVVAQKQWVDQCREIGDRIMSVQ